MRIDGRNCDELLLSWDNVMISLSADGYSGYAIRVNGKWQPGKYSLKTEQEDAAREINEALNDKPS